MFRLIVSDFKYAEKSTFLDYVFGGCEVSLIIGIDFTKSNGIQNSIKSLHHLSESRPNEYLQAIKAVGEILQYYDTDKLIPLFGFGARLPPHLNVVSHCFALNGDIFNPEVEGIGEVLTTYEKALSEVAFHGPTVFNELIGAVKHYASAFEVTQSNQKYFILLIITDGIINDIESSTREIIECSELPISIVIVGVGNEDFSSMELLDADTNPLVNKKTGAKMKRDIVQFVPYSKFKNNSESLAREVLMEIPTQLLEFMEGKGIKPSIPEKNPHEYIMRRFSGKSVDDAEDISIYLGMQKARFIDELVDMGFGRYIVERALSKGIACKSKELAIEMINLMINPGRKYLKDMKNEFCLHCKENKINCFSEQCGHLISCEACIREYTACTVCKLPISTWKILEG